MAKKIAVQIMDHTLVEDPMSVIVFRQQMKSISDAYRIHEGVKMWMFKQNKALPAVVAVETQVILSISSRVRRDGAFRSYSAMTLLLFICYVMTGNVAKKDATINSLTQRSMIAAEFPKIC